jgi:hypothetical protein
MAVGYVTLFVVAGALGLTALTPLLCGLVELESADARI